MKKWVVYKITSPSGRVYIGKSCSFSGRKSSYKNITNAVKDQRIIYNSLVKYGYANHIIEVIENVPDGESAFAREVYWIKELKSNHNRYPNGIGMNLTDGGDGTPGAKHSKESVDRRVNKTKGKPISDERKKFLSEYNKANPVRGFLGKKHSEDTKINMSLARKGKPSKLKGRKQSDENIKKNSASHMGQRAWNKGVSMWSEDDKKRIGVSKIGDTYSKGIKHKPESILNFKLSKLKDSKPILQYDLTGNFIREYMSKREAGNESGVSRGSINKILNGVTKNPKSFIFKYK